MSPGKPATTDADPYDLARFVRAQAGTYDRALAEIRAGQKRSHWMWYVFPQFDGLGFSEMSKVYAIKSIAEADAYLRHPTLGPRLQECVQAAIDVRSTRETFGTVDDMKLRSCATLFASVSPHPSLFDALLDRHFRGEPDEETLRLLRRPPKHGTRD